ncbi:MAG: ABC transporter ATP-binding protein [FCB group bacterium]|nr:ABC transporter ATP-binding protein [FCB group bacterium]MBL7028190.1 ABC transporter ATP-binding protein [Candidatus Neomarinimicrobiota bacterium]MBL7122504.1 ABC transporter ATP-binding protein [Candidatus Neomarinimicrobiota bacterium]
MDNSTLIKTQGLVKRYPVGTGFFTALQGVDLNVNAGEFVGLVGPSGSGKTTLLNIIGALDAPSEGTVEVLGKDLATLTGAQAAKHRSAFMGFIFQTYNLLPVYTVFENVEFPLLLLGKSTDERKEMVMKALDWVGIADKADSRPKMLSGGESQRVAIARAMVKEPKLVLADEPTANLDAKNSHHILETMVQLNKDLGTTFVFATHDEKVISYLRRKVTLVDGSIQSDETS